jgi:hypothetical protein
LKRKLLALNMENANGGEKHVRWKAIVDFQRVSVGNF